MNWGNWLFWTSLALFVVVLVLVGRNVVIERRLFKKRSELRQKLLQKLLQDSLKK
jgi:hypothetical protein